MMRSRIPNPYFEPLKGRPALLDDLIDRINAYGNYVGRLVRRRVQRSMAKCGFRERFPPFKYVLPSPSPFLRFCLPHFSQSFLGKG
ncbi:unnamed protein product [Dibothriocephalus latus]|uniref:Uncharacterized protein n=1 Tax=Dibothriocephalus latus TaxID=60516 RepID=A0A3P7NSF7_DIBLA|nr:unnamed protein product [Dibothriocephalus latus]